MGACMTITVMEKLLLLPAALSGSSNNKRFANTIKDARWPTPGKGMNTNSAFSFMIDD